MSAGCTLVSNVCNACLGSTEAGTTGRKRSVLLLTVAIVFALWFQYSIGPTIVNPKKYGDMTRHYRWIPGLGTRLYNSWYEPCKQYSTTSTKNNDNNNTLLEQCAGNDGVYRPMAIATLFFAISAVASKVRPSLNKELWPTKFGVRFLYFIFHWFPMYLC